MRTGLDRLLEAPEALAGRRYALLSHGAAQSGGVPAHLALTRAGQRPRALFAPEHGLYAVEQDMVPSPDAVDPWVGVPIRSLYGAVEGSLRPAVDAFEGIDLLVIDLQDAGARYYTYAATAVWAAEVAVGVGVEVWVLDRPNPLGGVVVEGNARRPGFESFVGAFATPVRHGLTLGELVRLAIGARDGVSCWRLEGWRRGDLWTDLDRPWTAPSPNMPTFETALVYPGVCLVEATTLSEGRGTTRPFLLVGAPGLDARRIQGRLEELGLPGVRFVPTRFKPQAQKHAGSVCEGVEIQVLDPTELRPFRMGLHLVAALREEWFRVSRSEAAFWRREPYEFVIDRPAIDLLCGDDGYRRTLEEGGDPTTWIEAWRSDEAAFAESRRAVLLYPEAKDTGRPETGP